MAVNLFVNRLYVLTEQGLVAYDERFHPGVNIIRGDNSSGKSTITHLLFYALGGDFTRFVAEARHCSRVWGEVCLAGATVTLSRPIAKDSAGRVMRKQGMTLHWGTLDEALQGRCRSLALGYAAHDGVESFSSLLFDLMGIPAVQTDTRITMNQLLRLMYVDQDSPSQALFVQQPFDTQARREAVADLLTGIYDDALYQARATLRRQEGELTDARAVLRSLQAVLPAECRSAATVRALIAEREQDIARCADDIARLRAGDLPEGTNKPLVDLLKAQLVTLAQQCARLEQDVRDCEYGMQDTRLFLQALTAKRDALECSLATRRVLGSMHLAYCPECLAPLADEAPVGTCRLCKSPLEEHPGATQARRMMEELTMQMRESEGELSHDAERLPLLRQQLRASRRQHKVAQQALDRSLGTARGSQAERIEALHYRQGRAQGELLQYHTLLEQAEYYERQTSLLARLQSDVVATRALIQHHEALQEHRRQEALACMQRHAVYFLHHDQDCQRAFAQAEPQDFHIDFGADAVYLQQPHARFSASSSFLLTLVARFALLLASIDLPWMRYPRFILADNMEDKGMEPARVHRFQTTLVHLLEHYPASSFQVIFTTSCLAPSLEDSRYVVGDRYSMQHKSLRHV